jgi:hypothetical protein
LIHESVSPPKETLRSSITSPFPIRGCDTSTIPLGKIAKWIACCGGLTPDRVPWIEAYVACLLSKEAYNPAVIEAHQWMKKATTRASKRARTKVSMSTVTATQLDCELASARPPLPPQDPATSVAWHQNNVLALPDHLQSESGPTTQGTRVAVKATPAKPVGVPQADPRDPPAPYTDVQMGDTEDILDWEPEPSPGHP